MYFLACFHNKRLFLIPGHIEESFSVELHPPFITIEGHRKLQRRVVVQCHYRTVRQGILHKLALLRGKDNRAFFFLVHSSIYEGQIDRQQHRYCRSHSPEKPRTIYS